jgi:hypothetical protein
MPSLPAEGSFDTSSAGLHIYTQDAVIILQTHVYPFFTNILRFCISPTPLRQEAIARTTLLMICLGNKVRVIGMLLT